MENRSNRAPALNPQDLARLLVMRANAGDVEGMVELYEPDAVLALPDGTFVRGSDAIRDFYNNLLIANPNPPKFEMGQQ